MLPERSVGGGASQVALCAGRSRTAGQQGQRLPNAPRRDQGLTESGCRRGGARSVAGEAYSVAAFGLVVEVLVTVTQLR
ncbi:hypothetical protein AQJ67_10035 [Streptomyces caeruleatus]|uniref:Uncharacterized protein n=1 Tax=Streptomyces caeruleatus TaxID=661399 RepID=A0A117RR94_9ACTN|nr:hypothetical protein AQJ67_10035 [Streptomyces caeruleatus]